MNYDKFMEFREYLVNTVMSNLKGSGFKKTVTGLMSVSYIDSYLKLYK